MNKAKNKADTICMKKLMVKMLCFFVIACAIFCGFSFQTPQTQAQEVVRNVPILMYHSVRENKKGNYVVTPQMFQQDIDYLKKHGFQPIFISQLIDFCEGKGDLHDKPVVLSFDDGHYNNMKYAFPILKKENFKANLNVIGCFCEYSTSSGDIDNPAYSYLTWSEIKSLHDSGIFEIGNHTYKMHSFSPRFGIAKLKNESAAEYRKALSADVMRLENIFKDKCGLSTQVFAYPFGEYNTDAEKILKQLGFKAFLTCNEGCNKATKGDCKILSTLKRINRTGLLNTREFFEKHNIS